MFTCFDVSVLFFLLSTVQKFFLILWQTTELRYSVYVI